MKKKAMFIAVSLVVSAPIVVGAYFLALRRYALEKPIAASQESGFLARQTSNSTAESAYKAPAATTTLPDLAAKKYWQVYINTQGEYEIRYPPTARLSASGAKTQIEFAQPFSTAANKGLDALTFNIRRSEEHTSELQSRLHLVCRLLLEKKNIRSFISTSLQPVLSAAVASSLTRRTRD